jgi:hypothetical protein
MPPQVFAAILRHGLDPIGVYTSMDRAKAALEQHPEYKPGAKLDEGGSYVAVYLLYMGPELEEKKPGRTPWRVGSHVPRNIYDADDHDIGRMDTAELAALVVVAVNADFGLAALYAAQRKSPSRVERVNIVTSEVPKPPPSEQPAVSAQYAVEGDERKPTLIALLSGPSRAVIEIDHIPWLVKDFDVLYRAADNCAAQAAIDGYAGGHVRDLLRQLERLKPAMEQIEAVKAALRGRG